MIHNDINIIVVVLFTVVHTRGRAHTHTHTCARTHAHIYTHIYRHAHTHTHARKHAHIQTKTLYLSIILIVTDNLMLIAVDQPVWIH